MGRSPRTLIHVTTRFEAEPGRVFDVLADHETLFSFGDATLDGEASLELALPARRWRILVFDRFDLAQVD